jgi:hypothetical protein
MARSEGPSTETCIEVKEQIEQRIRDNRKISSEQTAYEMSISYGKKWHKNALNDPSENILL